jgi:hypothetical protein
MASPSVDARDRWTERRIPMYDLQSLEVDHVDRTALEPAPKKPYATPKIVAYGTVSKLTQTATGSGGDGGTPGQMALRPMPL